MGFYVKILSLIFAAIGLSSSQALELRTSKSEKNSAENLSLNACKGRLLTELEDNKAKFSNPWLCEGAFTTDVLHGKFEQDSRDSRYWGGPVKIFDSARNNCQSTDIPPELKNSDEAATLECQLMQNSEFALGSKPRTFSNDPCMSRRYMDYGKFFKTEVLADYYYLNNRLNSGALVNVEHLSSLDYLLGDSKGLQSGVCNDPQNPKLSGKCVVASNKFKDCSLRTRENLLASMTKRTLTALRDIEQLQMSEKKNCSLRLSQNPLKCQNDYEEKIDPLRKAFPWISGKTFRDTLGLYNGMPSSERNFLFAGLNESKIALALKRQMEQNRGDIIKISEDYQKVKKCIGATTKELRSLPDCTLSFVREVMDKTPPFDFRSLPADSKVSLNLKRALINADCRYDLYGHQLVYEKSYDALASGTILTLATWGMSSILGELKVGAVAFRLGEEAKQASDVQRAASILLLSTDASVVGTAAPEARQGYKECVEKINLDKNLISSKKATCAQEYDGPTSLGAVQDCMLKIAAETALKVLPLMGQYLPEIGQAEREFGNAESSSAKNLEKEEPVLRGEPHVNSQPKPRVSSLTLEEVAQTAEKRWPNSGLTAQAKEDLLKNQTFMKKLKEHMGLQCR